MNISSSEALTNTDLSSYLYGAVSDLSDKVGNLYNDSSRKLRKHLRGGRT